MELDAQTCYRAVLAPRRAASTAACFTAVLTTGIYCRPSCPSRTPLERNVRFYPSAAAAVAAGFRACRRCRPDALPGSPRVGPPWRPRRPRTPARGCR